jgi:hypothetical protein
MTNAADRCVNPNEITDEDVIAFALGEASSEAQGHLQRCHSCRAQAEAYARRHNLVGFGLFRSACLPSLTIGEYVLGLLTGEALQRAAAHLSECPRCLSESRSYSAFMAQPDEPATSLFDAVRRLVLRPLAPSPALAALRGGASTESLTYEDAERSWRVHLTIQRGQPGSRTRTLAGLVELASPGGAKSAALFDQSGPLQSEELDAGNFYFTGVPAGTYRLEVTSDEATAVIEDVDVT